MSLAAHVAEGEQRHQRRDEQADEDAEDRLVQHEVPDAQIAEVERDQRHHGRGPSTAMQASPSVTARRNLVGGSRSTSGSR